MDLNTYQSEARGTAIYSESIRTIDGLTYAVLALCGETGELANKLKKSHRIGAEPNPEVLADELGDCLWYISAVAKELGYSLEEIAHMNLRKLKARKEEKQLAER